MPEQSADYERIAQAISYIQQHRLEQPNLDQLAAHVGLSPYHFQRLFVRWAGVSPKRFLSFLTVEHAKLLLRSGDSILDVSLSVGLSGASRLHDQFITLEGMTPGEYKRSGADLQIHYAFHPSQFGQLLVLQTRRGVCGLQFIEPGADAGALALSGAKAEWPLSQFVHDPESTQAVVTRLLPAVAPREPLQLLLRGTPFQTKVWQALLSIPEGRVSSYQAIAKKIGQEKASRPVGSAIGANPIAVLIPCHRVLRGTGEIAGYRWGVERKLALLGWEASRAARAG
ncbi:MAG: methylated-DNA--[protein]-cysteine S-methyltransferase [Sedimenticola sp.]|nr:methylated-DNA--[protein]-cysteine S-methyltransferase [Sedimenticola sp.]